MHNRYEKTTGRPALGGYLLIYTKNTQRNIILEIHQQKGILDESVICYENILWLKIYERKLT